MTWCVWHKWRARLVNERAFMDIGRQEANLGSDKTTLIRTCMRCGMVRSQIYGLKLTLADFAGSKIGRMLERGVGDEHEQCDP